ncbi:MAG: adenylate/guanylate cyclase domain-containing protein [Verrucomicrobiales bacterium]|nr:adenylate/guanylate cyclase domain-containing protein [Verrucomicrobiales bacterium]
MLNPMESAPAWLEKPEGTKHPIFGTCYLGRAASNQIALEDDRVSRRHAVIQAQLDNEFWLVDFGSHNGTYLNERRIVQPTRLNEGDTLRIGLSQFIFRQGTPIATGSPEQYLSEVTVSDIKLEKCWLLVADIIESTRLASELPPDQLPLVTGRWVSECKLTIESLGGRINQFMGDGFFAFWRDHDRIEVNIHQALMALQRMQLQGLPAFRFVLHFGRVTIGGVSVGEEERISGAEVHSVFRQEKLCAALNLPRLISEPAYLRLAPLVNATEAGRHPLQGFDGKSMYYTF